VVIREPVRIEPGVTLVNSTIGPNVTIEGGSRIEGSTVEHSLLGRDVHLVRAQVKRSVIGDGQTIEDRSVSDSVMDAGELARAR
jgi:NDP-sugar pyrophosphorylase family protein